MYTADLASDGQKSTFMATGDEQFPWLSVDIGDVYSITSVDILFHEYHGTYNKF